MNTYSTSKDSKKKEKEIFQVWENATVVMIAEERIVQAFVSVHT